MSVKKVSSEVAFITEPRTDFTRAAKDVEKNITLGSWPASSIVLARKWVEPDEATIEVELPTDFAFSIFPQRSDSNTRHRARYISIPTPVGQRRVFLIDEVDLQELDSETVKASIKALSPEAWLSQVPSTIAGADQVFTGSTATAFKTMLYESTVDGYNGKYPCTENIQGVQYRALPILGPVNTAQVLDHSQLSYYGITNLSFDPEHSPSDGKPSATVGDLKPPFPAPVGEQLFSLMKRFPYKISMNGGVEGVEYRSEFEVCLVPVTSPYGDGCLWWKLLFHTKASEPIWISRQAGTADGEATLHITSGKTDAIAWIASSGDGSAVKAATATFPGKPRYSGPWASVETKEVSEGDHLGKADAAREAAATLAGLQPVVTIDAAANAGSDAIDAMRLRPGTIAGVRFGKQAFQFPINEVDYSFSVESGWEIKAPVTVETNSIDYRYPSPPEPTTPPEPPEPPEPPVKPKAGLKKLYGNGSSGSIVQDLRGDWWLLCATIKSNGSVILSEPRVKRIEGLPADAELIAINKPYNKNVDDYNLDAIFQSGEKTLYVNTVITITSSTINASVTEISLDGKPVSVVRNIEDEFYVVTDTGSLYIVKHKKDSDELAVEKYDEPAGIFHPTTFVPGKEDGSIIVASSNYAALIGKPDYHQTNLGKIERVIELDPGETVISSPIGNVIVTNKNVYGISNDKTVEALKAHGGATGVWTDGHDGLFFGCNDGSLLWLRENDRWYDPVVAMPPAAGRIWRGVLGDKELALAWGTSGLVRLEKTNEKFTAEIVEKAPVLTAAGMPRAACFVTEAGELKIVDHSVVDTLELSFKPKRCWSSGPLGHTIGVGKNIIYSPGYTLVAGDGNDAALITQVGTGFPFHADKITFSSPVAEVLKPGRFFIRLEDGSLVDEHGKNILDGSIADGAKVLSIAEESMTGCCLVATDRGAFRVAATRDSIFVKPPVSQPEVGQVEKLEGSWGDLKLVGNGVMAGPEEAHIGHPAAVVKFAELTTQAVAAEPAGKEGCFLLLEDGSVCIQASVTDAFWQVAEPPKDWTPKKLAAVSDGQAIAWAEDGNSEVIKVTFNEFSGLVWGSSVTVLPKLSGGLDKLKVDSSYGTYAISGGKFFHLSETEWLEDTDNGLGEGSLTDFITGSPFCFRRGNDWLMALDGKLQKINGIRGDFMSRVDHDGDFMSTTGGAVDLDTCKKLYDAQRSEWQEQPLEPAVVSTEPVRFIEGGGEVKAVNPSGGLFKLKKTENEKPPTDHTKPWWPASYTIEADDTTVKASTVSKRGSTFWLGAVGLTDGSAVLPINDEQRDEVDWEKLASCACFGDLALEIHGLLVPLKNGKLAWLKPGNDTVYFNDATTEGLLCFFGSEDYSTYGDAAMLVATSGSVKAAFEGEMLWESPILITNQPKGLRGEETTPVIWGRFGVDKYTIDHDVINMLLQVAWPALDGLGAVKEARGVSFSRPCVICEHGVVSPALYYNEEQKSWPGDGLRFDKMAYGTEIAVIRTESGDIWLLSEHDLIKTGVSGIVADKESTIGSPITVADSSGLTRLTVETDGKLKKETVAGSKPATAAIKSGWQLAGNKVFVAAYNSETGDLQAATDDSLYLASEPTETGLTAIGGVTNETGYGPVIYGEHGVVAVDFDFYSKVTAIDWAEKLAALGLPTADDTDTGDDDSGDSELPIL